MVEQVNQAIDEIAEICDEKLEAKKSEHIFITKSLAQLKEVVASLVNKLEEKEEEEDADGQEQEENE